MDDPGIILARLIDKDHRGGADRNQHKKARREQQDLSNCAPAPSLGLANRLAK